MIPIIFKSTDPLLIDVMKSGKTIDYKYYLDISLKLPVKSIELERKTLGTYMFYSNLLKLFYSFETLGRTG